MAPVEFCFKRMQGLTTVVSEQYVMLDKLAGDQRDILVMNGPDQKRRSDGNVEGRRVRTFEGVFC
jgi:hypothetical protein